MRAIGQGLTLLCVASAITLPLTAAEIEGRVAEVAEKSVKLTVSGDLLPAIGDEVEVFVLLPGLNEEARVATARVTEVGPVLIDARIRSATGEVQNGQYARFISEKPRSRSEYRIEASASGNTKAWIGASIDAVRPRVATRAGLPLHTGVRILGVFPGGPTEGNILRFGDILLKVGGEKITGVEQFNKLIAGHAVGEKVTFELLRDGQSLTADLTLGSQPGDVEMARSLRVAAERGEAWAQGNLGVMHFSGDGVRQSDAQAVRWYLLAAEGGDLWAQSNLGLRYATGRGVDRDDRSAVKWFRQAAEEEHAVAQNGLGWMLANGLGIERDEAEAVQWYRRAAEHPTAWGDEYKMGSVHAQNNLADMYFEGRGVAKDLNQAREWYRKAAENGHADAQFSMGRLYYDGLGVTKDYREAMKWFYKAAQQRHAAGQTMMGIMILNGEGVKRDYAKAAAWLKLAVKQKNSAAQNALGVMYLKGQGVQRDEVEAFTLLLKSSEQGNEVAKKNLRNLGVEP